MNEVRFELEGLPAILYGDDGDKVYLFIHGKCGYKEEAEALAELVCPWGWQVLAIDLPGHGSRKDAADAFDPWHVVPELQTVMAYARRRWDRIALRATSIGAWFGMLAFQGEPLEQSLFVSPILNMDRLIQTMMDWAGVTEEELQARECIQTDFGETLSWQYTQYAKAHPIESWPCPTAILYAGRDHLTPRSEVDAFVQRFHCDLTVLEEGEHWFHTPEQLDELRRWTQAHAGPDITPEEHLFFAGKPEEWTLYEALRGRIFAECGLVKVKVQKTQITFAGKYGFAFVSLPRRKKDKGIVVSFGLFHRQESPRIQYASEPYPNRWTHHMTVQTKPEIDEELMGWLREAYWFSEQK